MANAKSSTRKTAPKKEAKSAKNSKTVKRSKTPYGSTVEILCTNPSMSKAQLLSRLKKRGIDVEAGKSAITTGIAQVGKIVKLLGENGHLKTA